MYVRCIDVHVQHLIVYTRRKSGVYQDTAHDVWHEEVEPVNMLEASDESYLGRDGISSDIVGGFCTV